MDATSRREENRPLNCYIVIPARLHSTRLPRKLLLRETGKSLLQHTYEAALQAVRPRGVIVATDHQEIVDEVESFGGQWRLTDPQAASGTDRVAEVAQELRDADVIVNLQGDEPELDSSSIDLAISLLEQDRSRQMSTLASPIHDLKQLNDPACVKVVFDERGRALYFSRSAIPFVREWNDAWLTDPTPRFWQHIGLYAYRREFLLDLARLPTSWLEQAEKLEQLRVLCAGHAIYVGQIAEGSVGIDTAADYRAFVERERRRTMAARAA